MTIEDIREYKKNAVEILRKHDQYATAKAVEEAFMALACLGQYMWERDVAISQLEELGLSLGQKVDHVKSLIDKEKMTLAEKELHKNATLYVNGANDFARYIKETYDKESVYAFEIEDILTQFLQQFGEVNKISK